MKPEERREKILVRLRAVQREWKVEEMAKALSVSPLTVRRDLDALAEQGAVLRTHGGCVYAGRMAVDSPYHRRVAENFELKAAIGRAAARELAPGQAIMINDGSTCFHLASNLGAAVKLTVYTNSIAMIPELLRFPGVRTYIVGGEYYREYACLGGGLLQKSIEGMRFDAVFIGADGVDPSGACRVQDQEAARIARLMLKSGRRRILLADHTKLGAAAAVQYGALSDFDLWITSPGIAAGNMGRLRRMTTIREAR